MKRPDAGYTKAYHKWTDNEELSDSAYRTLITIYSLWNPSIERWVSPPTVANVASIRKKHSDTIRSHFRELEGSGFIKRTREPLIGGGSNMYMEIVLPASQNPIYKCESGDSEDGENTILAKGVKTPSSEGGENAPITRGAKTPPSIKSKNSLLREDSKNIKQQQEQDGLSLLDGSSNLPNPNTYKPENLAPRKGAVLTEAQRNLATQLLGASGQDRQFAASVSQEMANKTGFLEFYLKATIRASKERKIKGTTIAYLIGSINNSWCNGDWVDPDQAAKDQKEKEIAARRARLDRLT